MTIPVSLVKVGNSNAIIIPAKILKLLNIKESTRFELSLEKGSTIQIRKVSYKDNLVFPKIAIPTITGKEMKDFIGGLITPDISELEKDERLAYILGK